MTILEIASQLANFDDDATLFAPRVDEEFAPQSQAVILSKSQVEREESANEFTAHRHAGLDYCLEIWIAKDAVKVWSPWRGGRVPATTEAAEAICHNATFDT